MNLFGMLKSQKSWKAKPQPSGDKRVKRSNP